MAYGQRNRFTNPATGEFYEWAVNHSTEDQFGRQREVTNVPTTGGAVRVLQQGDEGPLVLSLTGTILHSDQFAQMRAFFDLARQQTIYFDDFAGDSYEVIITGFQPTRQRTVRNPRDPSIPYHYWTYTINMQVVRVLAGSWVGTAP